MKNLKQDPRSGIWKIRVGVPAHLRSVLGKRELKKSLGHMSERDAQRTALPILNGFHRAIEQAKNTAIQVDIGEGSAKERQQQHTTSTLNSTNDKQLAKHNLETDEQLFYEAAQVKCLEANNVPYETDLPEGVADSLILEGEAAGYLLRTEKHLDEYAQIELVNLKRRSRNQAVSAIKQHFAKAFPVLHEHTVDSTKVQKWLRNYYLQANPPATETMNRRLRSPKNYFDWLIRMGYTDLPNPFENVRQPRPSKKPPKLKRQAFTEEDVCKLFNAMTAKRHRDTTVETMFLIALYTGCRVEEICRIKKSNLHQHDNRWWFEVVDAKTEAGNRKVPVHPRIQALMLHLIEASGNDYLIEDGSTTVNGERSSKLSKRFGRLKNQLGFGKEHVFHSLRRTFINQLAANNTPEKQAADLVGHDIDTMTYGVYGSDTAVAQLFEYVDAVSYPELEKLIEKN